MRRLAGLLAFCTVDKKRAEDDTTGDGEKPAQKHSYTSIKGFSGK